MNENEKLEAVALRFVQCINDGDVHGLSALMTDNHALKVFNESALIGRDPVTEGWKGYAGAFPRYRIVPHQTAVNGHTVAVLGHTTGSHLGLPDEEETKLSLIWLVGVEGGSSWTLIENNPENRATHNLK